MRGNINSWRTFLFYWDPNMKNWDRQWPIWLNIKESEDQIIIRRSVSNILLFLVHRLVKIAVVLLICGVFPLLWPWLAVNLAFHVPRTIALFRFRVIFDLKKKVFYKREYGTKRYSMDASLHLNSAWRHEGDYTVMYGEEALFYLSAGTKAYDKLIPLFQSLNLPIDRLNVV